MGQFVIKPKSDDDFYVLWSTYTDTPLVWGTQAELFEECPFWDEAWEARVDSSQPSWKIGRPTVYTTKRVGRKDTLMLCNVNVEKDGFFSSIKAKHLKKFCESYNPETDEFSDEYVIYEACED